MEDVRSLIPSWEGQGRPPRKTRLYRGKRKGGWDATVFEDLGMKSSHLETLWFLSEVGQTANLLRVWEGRELEKNKGGLIPFFE